MVQQSAASMSHVVDLHKLVETDVSDDDASTTGSVSSSGRSSGATRTTIARSFVWADADSDDDVDFLTSVASAAGEGNQQSIFRSNPSCMPRIPPGCNQPSQLSGASEQQAVVVVTQCFVPCAQSTYCAGWPSNAAQASEVRCEANKLEAQAEACAKRAKELRRAATQAKQIAVQSPETVVACTGRTTLVVKNLPMGCTHHELCRILNEIGLGGLYDFIYVPFDFKKSVFFRYGFVNFEQHEQAVTAMTILDGFSGWTVNGEKGCEVEWSGQQSLHVLIERYRNSPVMHSSVPDAYKPLLFKSGVHIGFPAATLAMSPPKHWNESTVWTSEVTSHSLRTNADTNKSETQARAFATHAKSGVARNMQVNHAAVRSLKCTEATEQFTNAQDTRTTLVVKNLPAGCTHDELRRILDEVGLGGLYNFIYVPFDFKKSASLLYGFVNFEQHEHAEKAMQLLDGFSGCVIDGEKACEVEWGGAQQSLYANIERYRNSPLMHGSVPDAYKPVLFERGVRVAFPAPTKTLKPLKIRKVQQAETC